MKIRGRKHAGFGSRIVRCCICEENPADSWGLHVPQLFCPVCLLWLSIPCSRFGIEGKSSLPFATYPGRKGGKTLPDWVRIPFKEARTPAGADTCRKSPVPVSEWGRRPVFHPRLRQGEREE